MDVLSKSWRGSWRQAVRGLRKGLGLSSEGGSTGRRTDWPCRINIAWKVRLLRPSVQLPAGIHGWGRDKDFERDGKGYEPNWPRPARPGTGAGLKQPGPAVSFGPDFRDIL